MKIENPPSPQVVVMVVVLSPAVDVEVFFLLGTPHSAACAHSPLGRGEHGGNVEFPFSNDVSIFLLPCTPQSTWEVGTLLFLPDSEKGDYPNKSHFDSHKCGGAVASNWSNLIRDQPNQVGIVPISAETEHFLDLPLEN